MTAVIGLATPAAPTPTAAPAARFSDVITVEAREVTPFTGYPVDRLALLACAAAPQRRDRTKPIHDLPLPTCRPIPFQVDERDAEGRWVLDQGPEVNPDDQPGVVDANDALLFMAADSGERVARATLLGGSPVAEISIYDPLANATRWAYLVAYPTAAPRAATAYVGYDPTTDRVRGGRVMLGFTKGVPGYLAIVDGDAAPEVNLLDRFKVRASATLLWGLLRFSRSEDDLSTQFVGWKQGPIRVIRRQRQWIRLGWGIRSPTFGSYTYFYRDFAELPVGLFLNFPPTYFFGDIDVRVILDFRDLRGWSLTVPSLPAPIPIDGTMTAQKEALNHLPDTWFALHGPRITLLQTMTVSPSLASVRRRLFYREGDSASPEPSEAVAGAEPGFGYQLDRWEHVGAGAHQLESVSYALPVDYDVRQFMDARRVPLQVTVRAAP